jgi:hypothetical protein
MSAWVENMATVDIWAVAWRKDNTIVRPLAPGEVSS